MKRVTFSGVSFVVLLFCLVATQLIRAQGTVRNVEWRWESLIETNHSFSLDELAHAPFVSSKKLNLGFFRGTGWIRITFRSHAHQTESLVIVNNDKLSRRYKFYATVSSELKRIKQTSSKKDDRTFNFTKPNFKITLSPGQERTFYIRFQSDGRVTQATPYVVSLGSYVTLMQRETRIDTFFYGGIFILLLLCVFFWRAYRENKFLLYLLYITSTCLLYAGLDGYLFSLPIPIIVSDHLILLSLRLLELSFLFFSIIILNTQTYYPNFCKRLKYFFVFLSALTTGYQFLFYHSSIQYLHVTENVISVFWMLSILTLVILSIRKKAPMIRLYIVALFCFGACILVGQLYSHFAPFVPGRSELMTWYKSGTFIEISVFVALLANWSGKNKKEADELRTSMEQGTMVISVPSVQDLHLKDVESLSPDDIFLQRIATIINQHLSDGAFNVTRLCRELGTNRNSLHQKLTALTGMSASTYVRSVRLYYSLELLSDPDLSIIEVAESCGFNTRQAFNKAFKAQFRMTPSEYRSNIH